MSSKIPSSEPLKPKSPLPGITPESLFHTFVDSVGDYAIFFLDVDGHVASWNRGAERIKGYKAAEIVGRHFSTFYTEDAIDRQWPARELAEAARVGRFEDEGWRVRKDGNCFWANVVITAMRDPQGTLRGFAKITRDLTERRAHEAQIRRGDAMEEQSRRITEFLAMLAHELRNPLAPIRNAVGILAASPETSPQVAWCRDVIERQTNHLSRLVDDLLDMSRITRGKLQMNGAPMDLNVAVHRAVEAARPLIESRSHRIDVRTGDEAMAVNGDMTRLTQAVLNLVNNAAKYTPEGGHIEVDVRAEAAECVVAVKDNGLGILPDLLGRVFDLFAQGERTLARSEGGLGIGLTLVRRIVTLHGGSIAAESEGAGKGATFTLRLPRLQIDLSSNEPGEHSELPRQAKRSILVVDDNTDAAASIAMFLRMLGHDVAIESDGPAALDRIRTTPPEIVFLDIGLPGLDGYEVARRVREKPEGQGIRLFAMTGYGQEEDRKRALASGFDAHLVKPVPTNDLMQLIETVPALSR